MAKQKENSYTPFPPVPEEVQQKIKLEAEAVYDDLEKTFGPMTESDKVLAMKHAYIALFRVKGEEIYKKVERAKNAFNDVVDGYTVQIEELTSNVDSLKKQIT